MSSSDRGRAGAATPFLRVAPFLRIMQAAGMAAALGLAAGCTARPLYGNVAPGTAPAGAHATLASVAVAPATDRIGQEVRNHLIFLLAGGQGLPASPAWRLETDTTATRSSAATVRTAQVSLEPTSGIVTVRSVYRLKDAATGETVASGARSVQAPYDIPVQDFAAARAVRDAENRAARELAELLRLAVAQALEHPASASRR